MNKQMLRFILAFMTSFILLGSTIQSASVQEPSADLALTKTVDRKNVKIGGEHHLIPIAAITPLP